MKSMNLRLNLMKWACVVLALAAVACDDDKKKTLPGGETTEGERTRTFFSNDYASGWKYFSFKKGNFIETPAKPNESLEWDIAFDRNYIRTNSGEGCKGNGGALDMNKTEFDDVPNLPTSGYEKDKTATIQNSPMSSQKEIETAINPAFVCHEVEGTWFYVAGMGGGYEYNNNVFGILCADGTTKAKLIMRSYGSSQIIFEFVYPAR